MSKYDEFELRERFEIDRIQLLASRLLALSGAHCMILSLSDSGDVEVTCSTGWVYSLSDFVGDALASADNLDLPLSSLV